MSQVFRDKFMPPGKGGPLDRKTERGAPHKKRYFSILAALA